MRILKGLLSRYYRLTPVKFSDFFAHFDMETKMRQIRAPYPYLPLDFIFFQ